MQTFCMCWLPAEKMMCQSEIQEAIGIESRAAPAADDNSSTTDTDRSDDESFCVCKEKWE